MPAAATTPAHLLLSAQVSLQQKSLAVLQAAVGVSTAEVEQLQIGSSRTK